MCVGVFVHTLSTHNILTSDMCGGLGVLDDADDDQQATQSSCCAYHCSMIQAVCYSATRYNA